jgi:hypothetical protein
MGSLLTFRALRSFPIWRYLLVVIFTLSSILSVAFAASPKTIEQVSFDWDHSGKPTLFTLSCTPTPRAYEDANRLTIKSADQPAWSVNDLDDNWGPLTPRDVFISKKHLSEILRQSLVPSSKRLLFIASGHMPSSRVYLLLVGNNGSLTVLTSGDHGKPRITFRSNHQLLEAVLPLKSGNGIEIVGQSAASEAWALQHAQSYDPFRAYRIEGTQPANYDLSDSESYTIAHYCQWHGPTYDERFGAIGDATGASHCRVMSRSRWMVYLNRHRNLFPAQ